MSHIVGLFPLDENLFRESIDDVWVEEIIGVHCANHVQATIDEVGYKKSHKYY